MENTHNGKPDNETPKDACVICNSTDNLRIHPSFKKLLCANCRGIADRNIP